jgi:hypothetical protein
MLGAVSSPIPLTIALLLWLLCSSPARESDPCFVREVPVTGTASSGPESTADLRLVAKIGGKPARVIGATVVSTHRILLLLDTSGSMFETRSKWETAQFLADKSIEGSPPPAEVLLATFEKKLNPGLMTGPREDLQRAVRAMEFKSMEHRKGLHLTSVVDSIVAAAEAGSLGYGDSVLVITDGQDNSSRERLKTASREMMRLGVRPVLLVLSDQTRYQQAGSGNSFVVDFVDATGGYQYLLYAPDNRPFSPAESSIRPFDMAMNSANIGRLTDVAKYIAAKAAQFVSVQMKLPRALDKPDRLSLHVVDASGRPLNSVHLAYPRELLPCSGP